MFLPFPSAISIEIVSNYQTRICRFCGIMMGYNRCSLALAMAKPRTPQIFFQHSHNLTKR